MDETKRDATTTEDKQGAGADTLSEKPQDKQDMSADTLSEKPQDKQGAGADTLSEKPQDKQGAGADALSEKPAGDVCGPGEIVRSCADCSIAACGRRTDNHPKFCDSKALSDDERLTLREAYQDEELAIERAALETAARVGRDCLCRVEEIMDFCRRMGYRKIGIANCGALQSEAVIAAKIFRIHGFEVFGVSCKFGELEGQDFFDEPCEVAPHSRSCNPLAQAARLNEWGTDFNIVMGLCVGHDSLFYRHSEAPTTTLVVKDRTLGNNPVAALNTCGYPAHTWSRLLREDPSFSPC